MGGILGGVGALAGGIGSLFGGGSSGNTGLGTAAGGLIAGSSNPPVSQTQPGSFSPPSGSGTAYNYIPVGQGQVDRGALGQLGYNTSTGQTAQNLANPMLATLLRNFMNDPTMAGIMPSANAAGAMSGQAGQNAFNTGGALNASVLAALPQFQKILAMGTDPQGALYDRTLAQTRDQMGASLAQQGLTGSGVGGAITNQGISNFNIDWQNQQLARALSALQGYGGAVGQAGQTAGQGAALQGTGVQETLNRGQIPYQASQAVMGGQQNALANFLSGISGSQNLGNQNLGQMLQYLSGGLNANITANNVASGALSNTQQQNAAAAGAIGGGLSSGLSGIGTGLGALANWAGGFPSNPGAVFGGGVQGDPGLGVGTLF